MPHPTFTLEIGSEEEMVKLAGMLARRVSQGDLIGLIGPLGAGKTLFVRAFATELGVAPGSISSPTFVLIHEYEGLMPVYHFDVYRLPDLAAFDALGAEDYWRRGDGVCLVEWADRVRDRLPHDAWFIEFEHVRAHPEARRVGLSVPFDARVIEVEWIAVLAGPSRQGPKV